MSKRKFLRRKYVVDSLSTIYTKKYINFLRVQTNINLIFHAMSANETRICMWVSYIKTSDKFSMVLYVQQVGYILWKTIFFFGKFIFKNVWNLNLNIDFTYIVIHQFNKTLYYKVRIYRLFKIFIQFKHSFFFVGQFNII